MLRFIIEHNIQNFIQRLRDTRNATDRDVLCRLMIAELDRYETAERREATVTWLHKLEGDIRAAQAMSDLQVVSNLQQVVSVLKKHVSRKTNE